MTVFWLEHSLHFSCSGDSHLISSNKSIDICNYVILLSQLTGNLTSEHATLSSDLESHALFNKASWWPVTWLRFPLFCTIHSVYDSFSVWWLWMFVFRYVLHASRKSQFLKWFICYHQFVDTDHRSKRCIKPILEFTLFWLPISGSVSPIKLHNWKTFISPVSFKLIDSQKVWYWKRPGFIVY